MYFSHARTLEWAAEVSELGRTHPAVTSGAAGLFLLPQFPSIPECVALGGPLLIGAQDVAAADSGAWTGEVSASVLAELGRRFAEVGHAERRRHFHETDDVVSAKTATAAAPRTRPRPLRRRRILGLPRAGRRRGDGPDPLRPAPGER